MFGLFKSSSKESINKNDSANAAENESKETKKCLNCLRRVSIDKARCPHCRKDDFQF